jgi:hypothetical protein
VQYNRATTASPFLELEHRTIPLPPVSLQTLETAQIDVRSALQEAGERLDQSGTAYIAFDAPSSGGINAYAHLLNIPKSLSLSLPFMEVAASQTSPLRAVAWRYSNHTDAYIGIENTSARDVSATVSMVIGGREREIREAHLDPGESDTIKLPSTDELGGSEQAGAAGVVVRHDGDAGALVAQGWLLDDDIGFSAPFGFRGGMAAMSSQDQTERILGTGVMIGNADAAMGFPAGVVFSPLLALWNPSTQPVVAKASFSYARNSSVQSSALPPINLAASGSVLINLRDYQVSGLIPADVAQGSIKLEYNASHGALLADLASVDQSGSFVSPVPLTCTGNRSMHMVFWRTDGAWESMVTLQNLAAESNDLEVKITWQGGEYVVHKTLGSGDTTMVSINEIQSSQQPDDQGRVIPRDVLLGGIDVLSQNQKHALVINAMLMNPVTRTCTSCNGQPYVTSYCLTDTVSVCGFTTYTVGSGFNIFMRVFLSDNTQDLLAVMTSHSDNSPVATANGSAVNAVAPGQANISGMAPNSYPIDPYCNTGDLSDDSPGELLTVSPVVLISGPSAVPLGTDVNTIQLTASVMPSGGSYVWSTISPKVTLSNANTGTVTVTSVTQSDARNDVVINLGYTVNSVTAQTSVAITVQKPASLSITGTDSTTAFGSCAASSCGVTRTFDYQVYDHLTPPSPMNVGGMQLWDSIVNTSTNTCSLLSYTTTCSPSNTGPCGVRTFSNGTFHETLGICTPACHSTSGVCFDFGCSTIANQTWNVNGISLASDVKRLTYNCTQILVNGH